MEKEEEQAIDWETRNVKGLDEYQVGLNFYKFKPIYNTEGLYISGLIGK